MSLPKRRYTLADKIAGNAAGVEKDLNAAAKSRVKAFAKERGIKKPGAVRRAVAKITSAAKKRR